MAPMAPVVLRLKGGETLSPAEIILWGLILVVIATVIVVAVKTNKRR